MFKIGDYVTRKKYGNDILFKIEKIDNEIIVLSGVDLRLYADAKSDDLILATISKKKEKIEAIRKLNIDEFFYLPGVILHFDSDQTYLDKCIDYYKTQKIKCYGFKFKESEFSKQIIKYINRYNPDIVVITGHDAYYKNKNSYRNSKYFINCVKEIRKNNDVIKIVAGACQSDFSGLMMAGATYASSPHHINIHALDPAIISSYLALSDKYSIIDLDDILSKTNYGSQGIGGIKTNGVMLTGYPRKDTI